MDIQATLDLAAAARRTWDVLVVGAGPAGTMAAREVARLGASVLLVDKSSFPRLKVCGCCINAGGLSTLAAVGLHDLVERLNGVVLQAVELAAGRKQAVVPLRGERALSRLAFDAALADAAIGSGVHFLPGTFVRLGELSPHSHSVHLRQGRLEAVCSARVVLAADGLGGRLLDRWDHTQADIEPGSYVGAGVTTADYPERYRAPHIFMACGRGGYVGLVRVEDGRLNLAAALDPNCVKEAGGLGASVRRILADSGFPAIHGLAELPWHGTPLLTRRRLRPAGERVLLLGDAAGYVEPCTGEGMSWALGCGRAAAPVACRGARHWDAQLERRWTRIYRRLITRRQWAVRALALLLRRPLLAHAMVRTLMRMPIVAAPVLRYLNAAPT